MMPSVTSVHGDPKGAIMAKQAPLKTRLSYWFDNFMSRGLWAKIGFLALVTIVFILIMGIIAAIAYGDGEQMLPWVWWKTVMTSLGKNTPGQNDGPVVYIALMIIAMIYGMFFSSMLIGFIAGSIRDKVNSLAKGTGNVVESNHIIILGFNETTYVLLGELIEANRNMPKAQVVVVLDETSKEDMDDAIAARFGKQSDHPKTRIVCRKGSIYDLASLERCSIATCRSIIVGASSDFETIKAIMACAYLLNSGEASPEAFAVAVIHEEDSVAAAEIAGHDGREGDRLELLPLQEILARIIVHTSRQPGLSRVFDELFNFKGNEVYTIDAANVPAELRGITLRDINLQLKDSIAIGVLDAERGIILANPNEVVLEKGQALIVVAEDDHGIHLTPQPIVPQDLAVNRNSPLATMRCLVFGGQPILNDMLIEYARYLQPGSTVTVVTEEAHLRRPIRRATQEALDATSVTLCMKNVDELSRDEVFAVLDEVRPDSVVVLSNHASSTPDAEDAKTIALLLYLRDYRDLRGATFGITSEMCLGKNREIAANTGSDDFVIGKHLSGLLMAQIALDRNVRSFFECLLSPEGFEVYMKPARNYIPTNCDIDLFSVIDIVAARGEMLIGIQQRSGTVFQEPQINPPKYANGSIKSYRFGLDDRLVLLSEEAYDKVQAN